MWTRYQLNILNFRWQVFRKLLDVEYKENLFEEEKSKVFKNQCSDKLFFTKIKLYKKQFWQILFDRNIWLFVCFSFF